MEGLGPSGYDVCVCGHTQINHAATPYQGSICGGNGCRCLKFTVAPLPLGPAQPPATDKILRYEVTLNRVVIVYASDEATARARALQLDGGTINREVIACREFPHDLEPKVPIIDRAPSRETQ